MFQRIRTALRRVFNSLVRALWGMLKQIFSGSVEMILAQIKDFTFKTVQELDTATLTNEEKRKKAFRKIKRYAKEEGIAIRDSLINLAIEIAVQYLKKGGK